MTVKKAIQVVENRGFEVTDVTPYKWLLRADDSKDEVFLETDGELVELAIDLEK